MRRLGWIIAGVAALGAVGWFTVRVAGPNIVVAGQGASEKNAVWTLRNLVWGQDLFVHRAGRTGVFAELSGARPVPGMPPLEAPLVREPFHDLAPGARGGVAEYGGYVFAVWVDGAAGGPVTDGDAAPAKGTRFVAYAWPAQLGRSGRKAFCIDQNEDLLESDNDAPGQGYDGPGRAPAWSACVTAPSDTLPERLDPGTGRDGGSWRLWRGRRTQRAREAGAPR